ncbi:MAG: hypothetical protein Greene101415_245 [Parcubacteria group bacterium Greene1014_15]|nr:MAG: hypothetical protein Greene101415_245 [Parcubacteria group bacterium Greene1014_15]
MAFAASKRCLEDLENITAYLERKIKNGVQSHQEVHRDVEKSMYGLLRRIVKDLILETQQRIAEDQKWASVKPEDYNILIKHLYDNG